MFIGFALLVSSCSYDDCKWEAVTENVYPTEQDRLRVAEDLEMLHPHEDFVCGELHRERGERK